MFKLKIISTGIIFLLVIFFISVNFKLQFKESILVDIPSGSSSSIIANILYENNLILNPLLFKTYSRFTSSDNSFKAGEYFIDTPESINSLISKIVLGDFFYRKLTLLPGSSLEDVKKLRYLEGLKDDLGNEFKLSMKQKGIILEEGIFYPDTYYYLKGETFSSILIKSHQKWKENYENLLTITPRTYVEKDMGSLMKTIPIEAWNHECEFVKTRRKRDKNRI